MQIPKMQENDCEIFLIFQIIAFELATVNFPNYYKDTCHWHSTCLRIDYVFIMSHTLRA